MEVTCKICGSKFKAKKCHVLRGDGKYCSMKCLAISQRTGKEVECQFCGKLVYKPPKQLNKTDQHFCNKNCAGSFRKRERSHNWKGGKGIYRDIAIEAHGQKCEHCQYNERKELLDVHHIDSDRNNNEPSNLMVLCVMCHAAVTRRLAKIEDRVLIWVDEKFESLPHPSQRG
jgi:hypothetical protein